MIKVQKIAGPVTMVAVVAGLLLAYAAHAQEDAWLNMTGGMAPQYSSQSGSMTALSYGENPTTQFPPKRRAVTRTSVQSEGSASYCVRTCDGRYFPVPSANNQSSAEGCKNLCPASETKVFSGSSIDSAYSRDGKPYSALANAFRYRKELVAGCTCNGKDVIGLASVSLKEDRTLRRGDIVANAGGLEVVERVDDSHLRFAKASPATRSKYERLPVLAAD